MNGGRENAEHLPQGNKPLDFVKPERLGQST